MIAFITWLRCLAAILITNAHYTGIYPTDIIANGGLIGDIVFFCVSGYCLTNLRFGFFKWYGKRLSRIFPVVVLISTFYLIIGEYDFSAYASGTENTLLYQALSKMGGGILSGYLGLFILRIIISLHLYSCCMFPIIFF